MGASSGRLWLSLSVSATLRTPILRAIRSTYGWAAGRAPGIHSVVLTLREAAQLMVERGASHLIVLDEASGHPVGVLATTDILQAYAAPLPLSTRNHP